MDFHFDPTASKHTSLVVSTFETAGTLLIALLLRLLLRGIRGQFLYYWSLGWVALAAGAVCLTVSYLVAPVVSPELEPWLRRPAIATLFRLSVRPLASSCGLVAANTPAARQSDPATGGYSSCQPRAAWSLQHLSQTPTCSSHSTPRWSAASDCSPS